jgi:hypothetical protein
MSVTRQSTSNFKKLYMAYSFLGFLSVHPGGGKDPRTIVFPLSPCYITLYILSLLTQNV